MWWNAKRTGGQPAFTVLEVIVALTLLGIGLVGLIRLFPMGLEASRRAEDNTRAAILAQGILESLKADVHDLPFIEGSPELHGIPGNGFDDDQRLNVQASVFSEADRNRNGKLDMDFDGGYVDRLNNSTGQLGPDGYPDGILQDTRGYYYGGLRLGGSPQYQGDANGDGDPYYDPENFQSGYDRQTFGGNGIDEELPNGKDDDGDGLIDEDCMLACNWRMGDSRDPDPLGPGDGLDNDGDGEPGSPTVQILVYHYPPDPANIARRMTIKVADGIDNNNDDRIDEGIDEEVFDGVDNDGDGRVDEDCRLAAYPFTPKSFGPALQSPAGREKALFEHPNERFSWQILVGRVSDNAGDGLDNDGDARNPDDLSRIDEDPRDGIDNIQALVQGGSGPDGRVDEDPFPMPLPGYRKVVVRITWGGDRVDNDNDGRVDEERLDGLDDDLDGRVDEDTYSYSYELTGYVQLKM